MYIRQTFKTHSKHTSHTFKKRYNIQEQANQIHDIDPTYKQRMAIQKVQQLSQASNYDELKSYITEAETLLHQVIEESKQTPTKLDMIYHSLGICAQKKGEWQLGVDYFTKAIKENKELAPAYESAGDCYQMLHNYTSARAQYTMYLKLFEAYYKDVKADAFGVLFMLCLL